MELDDDDDFYAPTEDTPDISNQHEQQIVPHTGIKSEHPEEDLEEGEEEDEGEDDGSDSDIDIITERKDGTKAAPPSQTRYNDIRNIPQRTASNEVATKLAVKKEGSAKGSTPIPSGDLPAIATSKIDIDAKPIYEPAGKPITQVNIDDDLLDNDKPWRRPGTDISDYFNYGFDEFTWALYATKQETLRADYDPDKIAQTNKKLMEDMNMMMAMGGMPGMSGPGATQAGGMAMPSMPGLEGIPPEMQAMMQQMMAAGIDPSQMDPAAMFASMAGAQGGAGAGGAGQAAGQGGGGQNQGFGAAGQGFGQAGGNQQQMGYGYDQGMMNGNNRGNFRGRGRGHRNW